MARILIVEDDELTAKLLQQVLIRKGGFQVAATEDVVEVAEEVEAVALAMEEVADCPELKARMAAPIQITIHLPIGINYHSKSETKFVKSVTRKASKAEPNVRLAICPSSNLQQSSVR